MSESRASRMSMDLALRVDSLVATLFPAARKNGNYWSIGSVAGEPGQSLYIVRHGERAGKWKDAATGDHGDLLDLIRCVQGGDLAGAIRYADQWLGTAMVMPQRPRIPRAAITPTPELSDEDLQRALGANEIWRQAKPIAGTVAEAYLRARGVAGRLPPSLRCHEGLDCWQAQDGERPKRLGRWPALIGAVQAPDNQVTAIHRIWLDGPRKAPVANPKRAFGPLGCGAIRLAKAGRVLGLAEGIETALSAMALFCLPVWCAIAAGRMASVSLPDCVEHVVIFGDHDAKDARETLESVTADGEVVSRPNPMFGKRPGEEAAKRALEAFERRGIMVTAEYPDAEESDWNDELQRQAKSAA